jgi:hypothetical protein
LLSEEYSSGEGERLHLPSPEPPAPAADIFERVFLEPAALELTGAEALAALKLAGMLDILLDVAALELDGVEGTVASSAEGMGVNSTWWDTSATRVLTLTRGRDLVDSRVGGNCRAGGQSPLPPLAGRMGLGDARTRETPTQWKSRAGQRR